MDVLGHCWPGARPRHRHPPVRLSKTLRETVPQPWHTNWTLCHGFFAEMGGMLLQTKDCPPFLVNSRQLVYLVEKYLECPQITEDDIWDKSKADTMSKILTLLQ